MKENWIRKLKNILNEYEDYKEKKYWRRNYKWFCYWKENSRISADRAECNWVNDCLYEDESRAVIISKGYNFIKRLVKNDKIDESKIDIHWFSFYESVLMELAIKDNPIEFLISVLK